ncbi:MAG: response regulator [Gemmatimonadetes bacterium]|jgi:DNA-binding NtrC family response regulator|nr:response regulator [Gemmatimonadota bacterium]
MKILIVDDEDVCSRAIVNHLQLCGYETSTARNGAEALDQITLRRPDVVIADVGMPRIDGPELLEEIDVRFGDIPVILIVDRERHEQELFSQTARALACFNKPFDMDEVIALLAQLRAHRHQSRRSA